ncbi:hypothetical protein C8Q74DRAFT_244744 [Fomes fomentarius]|nr:hypothetical protein C8Q74DRAFT_244744 [Fomes fomentarius]
MSIIYDRESSSPSSSTILERRAVDGEGFMQALLPDSISRVHLTTPRMMFPLITGRNCAPSAQDAPQTDGYSLVVCIRDATSARHCLSCREACATLSSSQYRIPRLITSCGHSGSRGRPRGTPVSPLHSTPTANPASRVPQNKGRPTRVVVPLIPGRSGPSTPPIVFSYPSPSPLCEHAP